MAVSLSTVIQSNSQLRNLGPGITALFVGGTSGLGLSTLQALARHTTSPNIYIVGRNKDALPSIESSCKAINPDAKVHFLRSDVTELRNVDQVCKEVKEKTQKLNLLVMSQGNLNTRGRDESAEGLDRKFSLNYYSRMRFITNLLPLLRAAPTSALSPSAPTPPPARVLSILGAGTEGTGTLDLSDLSLTKNFTAARCAHHSVVMNSFFLSALAAKPENKDIAFVHTSPGIVNTGIARELPVWARWGIKVFMVGPLRFMLTDLEEAGERALYAATADVFPPKGMDSEGVAGVRTGIDGEKGSGAYLVGQKSEPAGKEKVLRPLREQGVGGPIWEHTMEVFGRVEKLA